MPLVVVGDSGGAADWIARRCHVFDTKDTAALEKLIDNIRDTLTKKSKSDLVIQLLDDIVCKRRKYVRLVLFRFDGCELHGCSYGQCYKLNLFHLEIHLNLLLQ